MNGSHPPAKHAGSEPYAQYRMRRTAARRVSSAGGNRRSGDGGVLLPIARGILPALAGNDESVTVAAERQAACGKHSLERFLRRQAIDGAVQDNGLDTGGQRGSACTPPHPVMAADPLQKRTQR